MGLLIGMVLPLLAATLYRTYALTTPSPALEITRQLGMPYVLGEVGIILYAGRCGFTLTGVLSSLQFWVRVALALFLATFWISSLLVSARVPFSTSLSLIWIFHLYTGAAVFHLAREHTFAGREIAIGLTVGLAALAIIAALHLYVAPPGSKAETWRFGAPIPGFVSSRLFGAWAGATATLLLGLAWRAENGGAGNRWLYLAYALASGLVAWTGTRAALAAAVAALLAAMLIDRRIGPARFWTKALVATVAGSLIVPLLLPSLAEGVWLRPNQLASANDFASGRLALWVKTLTVATGRPLLGHGMGSNWWLVSMGGFYHVQPHNALVEFLMNWGLIPTIPALALFAAATWRVHGRARRLPFLLPLVMTIDYLLVASMFDGMLHFSEFVMLLMVLFGICLAARDAPVIRPA